jgi:hypothetical protein
MAAMVLARELGRGKDITKICQLASLQKWLTTLLSALREVMREVRNMSANALPTINALLIIAGTGTHLNRSC